MIRTAWGLLWGASVAVCCTGCGTGVPTLVLPGEITDPVDTERFELIARFVHLSDTHLVDEQSPGRLAEFAELSGSAWRPQEAYSTQLLDGMIRTVNKLHVARMRIDFLIHTGDATDNAQLNELKWFVSVLDGGLINPLTGPDDRDPSQVPDPLLDPHHSFVAQGLYRNGVHGPAPTIPWYSVLGNHDQFALGVFPIVTDVFGQRTSPLPLRNRIGLFFPVRLDPAGSEVWGPITPANPGPPPALNFPTFVPPNPERRYITDRDFVDAHLNSVGEPPGHGFSEQSPDQTWYSVSPAPGLRLIALNTGSPIFEMPTFVYSEGAISLRQLSFLRRELEMAQAHNEWVIVATHHPSDSLNPAYGTALAPRSFRQLLNEYPCVKLHLCGHTHRHETIDRGGYAEIVTGSIIDAPQQARVVELWRAKVGEGIELRYRMITHLEEIAPPDESQRDLFADPLLPMRRRAAELAGAASLADNSH